jgi:hypothetical protein
MADIESQIVNFYESTLATLLASAATSATVASAPTTNGTTVINASSGSPIYLVIDPDNSGNREVVSVTTSSGTTLSAITRDLENRYGGTPPDHQVGTTIRLAVLAEHFEDMNDRLDTGLAALTGALQTSDLQDDDTFSTAAADKVASSESIKAYVDTQDALKLSLTGGTLSGNVAFGDNEASGVVIKDYAETDVALSSSSGVVAIDLANGNTGSLTLTENVTDIDFTNVPANGVSTFTLKITQDAASAYTVAINAITVNGGGDVTAKTAGAGGFSMTATLSAEDLLFFLFFDAGTPYLTAQQEMS